MHSEIRNLVSDDIRRVLSGQLLVALVAGVVIVVIQGWNTGWHTALSVVYGGGVALLNTLLLMWRTTMFLYTKTCLMDPA